ncbi:MAG: ethanolamine ammonia-lyase reactivating factor EutA [Bacillota bacterium]|nr:ethanolamine ammonia-lyase reactivating factor EutA [Bacillota bacterium]
MVFTISVAEQKIISVGIDIGTTTTQLVLSRLTVRNSAPASVIPHMEISDREVLYRSDIHFTPIDDHLLIDAGEVADIIAEEYQHAGMDPYNVETGAVIITGETAKKENAANILDSVSEYAGDFVVATAGVNLESILAGRGSGAAGFSEEHHKVYANIDVGGGTANIGVFNGGRVIDAGCINVGGHLIEFEKGGDIVTFIAEPAQRILNHLGMDLQIGHRATQKQLITIAEAMADICVESLVQRDPGALLSELLMTPPLKKDYEIYRVVISGGVADYVYSDFEPISVSVITQYGDIGPVLGWALRNKFKSSGLVLEKPLETIRATVIGAGIHSMNISGSTIHVDEETLPLKNIMVLSPFGKGEVPDDIDTVAKVIKESVERISGEDPDKMLAIYIDEPADLTYKAIAGLARGICRGMADYLRNRAVLIVVLGADCGKALGQCLEIETKRHVELVCVDQIQVDEGDYIDIGSPIMGGRVVPVVVKTLVFDKGNN